jgi:ABC-type branched-subunit amino acid transport system substrate-binding protein
MNQSCRTNHPPGLALPLAVCLALAAGPACLASRSALPQDGVKVGVLLPYTGELASVGQNLERAVILANERLASAEPDPGSPPFRLLFRDTHSDDVQGYIAAEELVEREQVAFLLGPEEASLAEAMAPLLRDRAVAITGGAVSLDSSSGVNDWFRIVPTAKRMGAALADRMVVDGVRSLAIVHATDSYGLAFSRLAADEFRARGGTVPLTAPLSPDVGTGDLVREVAGSRPDAILLVAYPTAGAALVQEWANLGSNERWYFAPSLRSEVFALNVPPGLLDGMVGISAGLPADARNFANAFSRRWGGEQPTPNAHYYFDAMVLAGLAHRCAVARTGTTNPTPRDLAAALVAVSGPGGTIRTWQDLPAALQAVESQAEIDYRGASGAVDFSPDGNVPQGFVQFWTIRDSTIRWH